MCTVTVVTLADSATRDSKPTIRLACNRDELRIRPTALPPTLQTIAGHKVLMPIDPQGGGTWIAVNDAGLAMSLLNFNPRLAVLSPGAAASAVSAAPTADAPSTIPFSSLPPSDKTSRGLIIPSLLHCSSASQAVVAARKIEPGTYQPFRLVIADRHACFQVTSDGVVLSLTSTPIGDPILFTSSGLGDALVELPRRTLFNDCFKPGPASAQTQDAFHRARFPGRDHLSVCMSRPDASTVSFTTIEIRSDLAIMSYHPGPPLAEKAIPSVVLQLSLRV